MSTSHGAQQPTTSSNGRRTHRSARISEHELETSLGAASYYCKGIVTVGKYKPGRFIGALRNNDDAWFCLNCKRHFLRRLSAERQLGVAVEASVFSMEGPVRAVECDRAPSRWSCCGTPPSETVFCCFCSSIETGTRPARTDSVTVGSNGSVVLPMRC